MSDDDRLGCMFSFNEMPPSGQLSVYRGKSHKNVCVVCVVCVWCVCVWCVCVCGVWCVLFVCVWCVCVVCVVCVFVVCVVCVCVFVCGVLSGLLNFISKFYGWSPLQDHKPAYFYRWEFLKFVSIALHSDFIILSIANIGTSAFIRNFYLPQYDEWGQSYHLHTNTNNAQGVLNLTVTRLLFFFLTMSAFLLWIIKHAMAIHVTGHVASTRYYIFNTNS